MTIAFEITRILLSLLLWLALVGIAQWLMKLYHVRCAILAALERMAEKGASNGN